MELIEQLNKIKNCTNLNVELMTLALFMKTDDDLGQICYDLHLVGLKTEKFTDKEIMGIVSVIDMILSTVNKFNEDNYFKCLDILEEYGVEYELEIP